MEAICKICGKKFSVKPSNLKRGWGKFCSLGCRDKGASRGEFKKCAVCKKSIWRIPKDIKSSKSGKFFCNKSCHAIWKNRLNSGDKHPNWQGGKFKDYRNELLKNGSRQICKICGIMDKRVLVAHHLDKNRTNNNLKNLVWLCLNCHYLVHNYQRKTE
jgi:hypothetical protein